MHIWDFEVHNAWRRCDGAARAPKNIVTETLQTTHPNTPINGRRLYKTRKPFPIVVPV